MDIDPNYFKYPVPDDFQYLSELESQCEYEIAKDDDE